MIGFQGILRYKLEDQDASFAGTETRSRSSRRAIRTSARPTSKIGPDGAIYFLDWQNPIIGHMQHNLRDPSRDRDPRPHLSRDLRRPRRCSKPAEDRRRAAIDELLDLLKEPEDRVRYRARIELGGRQHDRGDRRRRTAGSRALDKATPNMSTTCWKPSGLTSTTTSSTSSCSKRVLASPDFHARAAATRVLCVWRDRVGRSARAARTAGER